MKLPGISLRAVSLALGTLLLAPLAVNWIWNKLGPEPDPFVERRLAIKESVDIIRQEMEKDWIEYSGIGDTIMLNSNQVYTSLIKAYVDESFAMPDPLPAALIALEGGPVFESPNEQGEPIMEAAGYDGCPGNSSWVISLFFLSSKQREFEQGLGNVIQSEFISPGDVNYIEETLTRIADAQSALICVFGDPMIGEIQSRYQYLDELEQEYKLFPDESPTWMHNFAIEAIE